MVSAVLGASSCNYLHMVNRRSKFQEYNCITCTSSVDCGPPGTPQHGSTNFTDTIEGSVVFYSCDQHLVPEGRMRVNCTRNGWRPINPGRLRCTEGLVTED